MKNLRKNLLLSLVFGILFLFILCFPSSAKEHAYLGLHVWFTQMIPSLLPFMILSSVLVGLNLEQILVKPISVLLRRLFHVNDAGIYVIVMGFLCGFPMGAKTAALEYESGKISKDEAEFLLAFTNNIGPAYFLSFVYGIIYPKGNFAMGLFILYGIPFLYGILLRYSLYRHRIVTPINTRQKHISKLSACTTAASPTLFSVLDTSITKGLIQISMLGGYMILCNLLVMIPKTLFHKIPILCTFFHNVLEISGGLLSIRALHLTGEQAFIAAHISLAFTGLSCHLQTFHILNHSGLSCQKYMLHKIILCSIVCITLFLIK